MLCRHIFVTNYLVLSTWCTIYMRCLLDRPIICRCYCQSSGPADIEHGTGWTTIEKRNHNPPLSLLRVFFSNTEDACLRRPQPTSQCTRDAHAINADRSWHGNRLDCAAVIGIYGRFDANTRKRGRQTVQLTPVAYICQLPGHNSNIHIWYVALTRANVSFDTMHCRVWAHVAVVSFLCVVWRSRYAQTGEKCCGAPSQRRGMTIYILPCGILVEDVSASMPAGYGSIPGYARAGSCVVAHTSTYSSTWYLVSINSTLWKYFSFGLLRRVKKNARLTHLGSHIFKARKRYTFCCTSLILAERSFNPGL